jgi:glucosamine--fructose-6-phosphate aminotransferase (isomerizing)
MIDCFMAKETTEQPGLFRRNAARWGEAVERAIQSLGERPNLVVIGRGSSGNACTFASYLFAMRRGRFPIEFRPWICSQTEALDPSFADAAAFAYSSSGQSTDVAQSASWLRSRGARVLGITNAAGECNLSQVSDAVLRLDVGEERAIPATKSFSAQLFLTAGLCGYRTAGVAESIASSMESILASGVARQMAEFAGGARTIVWIARGPALAAAKDAALKIQEAAGMISQAWSAAEMLHGPIAAMGPSDRVILLQDSDEPAQSLDAVSTRLVAHGTPHLLVADDKSEAGGARPHLYGGLAVRMPLPDVRWARTISFAFLSQLVTLELVERAGKDPDQPFGLSKVTPT